MTIPEKPLGMAIVVCDQVITDQDTHKKTLVGVFNNILSRNFPCMHPTMSIYVALTNGHGAVKIELACKELNVDEEVFARVGLNAEFPNPNHVVTVIFNLKTLNFKRPGVYSFEIYADDQFLLESRVNLTKVVTTEGE